MGGEISHVWPSDDAADGGLDVTHRLSLALMSWLGLVHGQR